MTDDKTDIGKNDENKNLLNDAIFRSSDNIDGYLQTDIKKIGDGKQLRVLVYVSLALIPCLFLIPFFMSRDFVPPSDPEAFRM